MGVFSAGRLQGGVYRAIYCSDTPSLIVIREGYKENERTFGYATIRTW